MIEKSSRGAWRRSMLRAGVLDGDGCSGMRIKSAPPAIPMQGDPAGVAAHHLDDDDAVVRLGGRVQPVDRLGGDRDRRVEAEGVVGAGEVVVDRLRDADDGEAGSA